MDPRELLRRLEILEHEAAEIAAGRLRPGEAAEITRQLAAAQHGETIASGAVTVRETLLGGGARRPRAGGARRARAPRPSPGSTTAGRPLADRLAGLEAEVEDVAAEVRALAETVDHDPATLARLEDRLGEIHRLLRRYGDDEAAVIAHGERAAAEAARLRGLEDERARRAAEDARLLLRGRRRGGLALDPARRGRPTSWAARCPAVLAELGFPAGRLRGRDGTPPGRARRPRGRGGRRRRRLRRAPASTPSCSRSARTPASRRGRWRGSRRAASCRGSRWRSSRCSPRSTRRPRSCSTRSTRGSAGGARTRWGAACGRWPATHQVLCVTHLPQIAAYADAHYRIAKRERDGRTVTEVTRLDRAEREAELAQMIGGRGRAARRRGCRARELLDRAEAWRPAAAAEAGA